MNDEPKLGEIVDIFYWSIVKLHTEYEYEIEYLITMLQRHLNAVEQLGENQIKTAGSYRFGEKVVKKGLSNE